MYRYSNYAGAPGRKGLSVIQSKYRSGREWMTYLEQVAVIEDSATQNKWPVRKGNGLAQSLGKRQEKCDAYPTVDVPAPVAMAARLDRLLTGSGSGSAGPTRVGVIDGAAAAELLDGHRC